MALDKLTRQYDAFIDQSCTATAAAHRTVHVLRVCVCVWPWTGPIWKQLLAARALRHPQCLSLWAKRNATPPPPLLTASPFFSLSLSPLISIFFSLSLSVFSLPLFLERVLSRSLCTKLLSHEPWQRGQGDPPTPPVHFIYFLQETLLPFSPPPPYLNSRHTFPICTNKTWKYQL